VVGHGYVQRHFDGRVGPVWMKRYRCVGCKAVHTLRPTQYWRKFLASISEIVSSLRLKIEHQRWSEHLDRQRQQYWWRGFRQRLVITGFIGEPQLSELWRMLRAAIIAATHSLRYFEIRHHIEAAYRTFAFTAGAEAPYP
jgi:hypothetical protein